MSSVLFSNVFVAEAIPLIPDQPAAKTPGRRAGRHGASAKTARTEEVREGREAILRGLASSFADVLKRDLAALTMADEEVRKSLPSSESILPPFLPAAPSS